MNEISPVLIAVGVLITAIASAYIAVKTSAAKIAAEATLALALATKLVADETKRVTDLTHDAVNSKMDKMQELIKTSSRAEGVIEGKMIEKSKSEG